MMKPAKRLLTAGMLALALLLAACAAPKEMPEDFQFSLVWNTYGISSYDSGTGVLIKTTDATHPENYETELHLSSDEMRAAWEIIAALDLADYPAEYDPNPDMKSKPGVTLVLSVFQGGTEKTIRCEDIALCHDAEGNYTAKDKKGQAFLRACQQLIALITATPEWQALPEYEFLYE